MKNVYAAGYLLFLRSFVLVVILLHFASMPVNSQTAITSASTNYVTATTGASYTANGASGSNLSANTYAYKYGNLSGSSNNNLRLSSFIAGGVVYNPVAINNAVVKMRRVNNAFVSGTRNLKFEEGTVDAANKIMVAGTYNDDMESAFKGFDGFNAGTDNLFANTNDANGNVNNIERLDVVFPTGTKASDNTKVGFAVFERGAAGQHDPVKVALIMSIDINGRPASYSNIISVTAANYGEVQGNKNYLVSRRDNATDTRLMMSTSLSQGIGGVLFKYSDFGIANNTRVYGYSLFCNDFTGSKAQAVDYTNGTYFPTDSDNGTGFGGIDLVAVTGIAQSASVLPVELTGFTVKLQSNNQVLVQWMTSIQSGISNYTIEYSADNASFKYVAVVPANNKDNETYTVFTPAAEDGAGYYRLKITDTDGKISYSAISKLNGTATASTKIFPNPAKDVLNINVGAALINKPVTTRICSAAGILLSEKKSTLVSRTIQVNVNWLPAGNYVVQLITGKETISQLIAVIK